MAGIVFSFFVQDGPVIGKLYASRYQRPKVRKLRFSSR